jgi:hypothetical protein
LIILIILGEKRKLWSSSLCSFERSNSLNKSTEPNSAHMLRETDTYKYLMRSRCYLPEDSS